MKFFQYVLFSLASMISLSLFLQPAAQGQDKVHDKGIEVASKEIRDVLDQVEGLFYKTTKEQDGSSSFVIVWEENGEISKIKVLVQSLGYYGQETLYGILAFSIVAESEKPFPPAVIKMVTVESDKCGLGAYTMPETFDNVIVYANMPSDTLTPGQAWLTFAYVHKNRMRLKKEIEQIVSSQAK
jgi:hypothetical protein